ncbi:MAG: undecaprenyl-diphosphate phosphatase [Oscillospiraceae bacterium]|jgi:undecaprenyl-diphosphatase|nr:undecaprenyl-diphosphate phosphatase [Oscillospiraceae bacterium]
MQQFENIIKALILGLVEGITEWLPVSSTGHMILFDEALSLGVSPEFMRMFLVVIQLGAVLAVALVYFRRLFPIAPSAAPEERRRALCLWGKIILACLPAAIIGILFDKKIDELFFNWKTVAAALIFYGIIFILIERPRRHREKITTLDELPLKTALYIGLFQLLSLIPGTSRSGATIIGAMLLGLSRTAAAEFSFFLAVPVMLGAGALKILKFGVDFTKSELIILLVGAGVAFLVSIAAIRFLTGFVKRHKFTVFGWYRIALGALCLVVFGMTR